MIIQLGRNARWRGAGCKDANCNGEINGASLYLNAEIKSARMELEMALRAIGAYAPCARASPAYRAVAEPTMRRYGARTIRHGETREHDNYRIYRIILRVFPLHLFFCPRVSSWNACFICFFPFRIILSPLKLKEIDQICSILFHLCFGREM